MPLPPLPVDLSQGRRERADADPGPALRATFGSVPDTGAPDRDEWSRG